MTEINSSPGSSTVMYWWSRCEKLPAGRYLFSVALGWFVPYSGSIGARVEEISPGYARLRLADRRRVRNHLNSIHAIALVNFGEIASGLALFSVISANMRGILTDIRAQYLKKARGKLTASASFVAPDRLEDDTTCEIETRILDREGDLVCIVTATWLLGYRKS
ncbi:MAG: DUF4442 domain-containing protein [Gammaproteobacteria bacterium]|jgi:acyl-coenzyme A thioesterase PaaI-like protein